MIRASVVLPPINSKLGVRFEQLIVAGGDDRLDLLASGLNRYHVRPTEFEGVFNRASCTCSPFSPDGYEAATELYPRLDHDAFEGVLAEHTRTLKELINYDGQDRFHVFYAPSGSDLCYYPLLFFRLIHRERKIFNVITCPEELGSGSNLASSGRYYFTHNPMGGVGPRLADVGADRGRTPFSGLQLGDPFQAGHIELHDLKIVDRTSNGRSRRRSPTTSGSTAISPCWARASSPRCRCAS